VPFLGRARNRWSWTYAVGTWVVVFTAMFFWFNVLGQSVYDEFRLTHSAANVESVISRVHPNDHDSCDYRYVVGDKMFAGSTEDCGTNPVVGDVITVRYLSSHPSVSGRLSTSTPWLKLVTNLVFPTVMSIAVGLGLGRPGPKDEISDL
jgi:hypothetical protein